MPRKLLIKQSEYSYHITSRSNHRDWFSIDMNKVWEIATESLSHAYFKHKVILQAFVLMNNHYHLILKTPNANINDFMYEFNKKFSLGLRIASKKINRMFGGRYRWTIVDNQNYFYNIIRYVYQNPLRAKIVDKCENFPYSDLYFRVRKKENMLGVQFENPIEICDATLEWINYSFNEKERKMIFNGLKKTSIRHLKTSVKERPYVFTNPPVI